MQLSYQDRTAILVKLQGILEDDRAALEAEQSEVATAHVRGRISALREMLDWFDPKPVTVEPEDRRLSPLPDY
jgi:hypothetical protein